jgi:DNA-binding response OmpR family regulator
MSEGKTIVALAADLIFSARIRATAQAQNVSVTLARDVADFLTKVRNEQPRLAILDLDRRGLDITQTVAALKALNVPLLAYVSHTEEAAIAEARAAGADQVLARGAFANQLAELLKD